MEKYIICEALGYGKIGEEIESFESFSDLKKAIIKKYKNSRYLVTNTYCNYIYFSGLQLEPYFIYPIKNLREPKHISFSKLKEEFKDDFYHRDLMYI